ncbi:MAG: hypothetical protein EBU37_07290, partial [Actinobacteria bacterium]|nr:hypothetical protein [Actinomycetota bacterium]
IWIVGSVAYGGVRIALVWRYLQRFGVNLWIFSFIELLSSLIYGISSAHVVKTGLRRAWLAMRKWFLIAVASYFAPDIYVFASARDLPLNIRICCTSAVKSKSGACLRRPYSFRVTAEFLLP